MLIYNYQKEFLGIDEKDLKTLGFNSLSELRAEVTDFADLFVKTPGYVHNFQHVHWIDFISYADISEESKVLINVNSKTFKATLAVSTIFLIDNPTSPAYMIYLNNLRPISKSESSNLSNDVLDRELPKVKRQEPKVFTPEPEPAVAPAVHDTYDSEPPKPVPTPQVEPQAEPQAKVQENYDEPLSVPEFEEDDMLDVGDLSLDVFDKEETSPSVEVKEEVIKAPSAAPKKVIKKKIVQKEWDNGYQYDPQIASKELGLPLDLIEEFIQDFIAQAKDFKAGIYSSIEEGDIDNVKILSHKLKGVAANLRIEDAHEVLSTVSASSDMDVIHENLNTFYMIIAKLAGEAVEKEVIVEEDIIDDVQEETVPAADDDMITLDFKDDEDDEDDDVPLKIEMPELADDDFLKIESIDDEITLIDDEKSSEESEQQEIYFSKADAAKAIGIDETSFNELFEDFVTESHTIFTKIKDAIKQDNLQICRNEALRFKGMSDNMRFHEFTQELETLIHSSDKDAIVQAAEKIDISLSKISEMGV
jgi:HPt (histidine-containing phosphotransfer) domain-containing protein